MKKSTFRKALVAGFATATLATGALVPVAPAHAADDLPTFTCNPGDAPAGDPVLKWSTDCSTATPSVIAAGADAILGLIAPGIKLGDLNKAIALPLDLGSQWNPDLLFPGNATISGSGFASAIGAGGTGIAIADYVLSGAIGIGGLGGVGLAHANLGGFALAAGIGDSKADAVALPGGIALAVGLGNNVKAVALGGVTAASGSLDDPASVQTICTAVYGSATVTDPATGKTLSSCTSVMFVFQKSQQGDGPVVYAIKNPLSLALANPLKLLADFSSVQESMGIKLPIPKEVMNLLGGNIIPKFNDDLIRVVMTDSGPKIESDLFKGLGSTGSSEPAPVAATADVTPAAGVATKPAAPETPAAQAPVVEAPATEAPAVETPAVEAPAVQAPVSEAPAAEVPAAEAPASDAPAADEAPAADQPAVEAPAAA
ncbi:hypothetical protein nbrc107696_05910 [Gordonia spumicola]|uniref:PE-PGRS family protein n=1 Tax=Gordonia spumicola TaxID=589161 RepID=A0A7I9V3Y8_9ACTN|nr:hypothetical protein [Gordonia spumicola]GEE00145.1 hypothetical protein nbrc107696_05910 [Gordonia spumicola]